MTAAYTVNPALTGMVIAYRNRRLIADDVMPRVPVGTKDFKYHELPLADAFTVPKTLVGRKGTPLKVEFGMVERTGSVDDHGLSDDVPQDDITQAQAMRQQGASFDPMATAAMNVADLIALGREARVAARVFSPASYLASQRVVLSGTSQWSDPASNPITAITDALDVPIIRPNVCVMGRTAWTKTSRNPALVKAANRSSGDSGMITRAEFAEMFELEEVLVGESFINTARPGQAAAMARAWGPHVSFFHRDTLAGTGAGRATFGITAQWGNRVAKTKYDDTIGLRGAQNVLVGESVAELITGSPLGFFFENAVG